MKKNRNYLFFITPGFVVYTIFAIIPILYVVYLAFTNYTGMGKSLRKESKVVQTKKQY